MLDLQHFGDYALIFPAIGPLGPSINATRPSNVHHRGTRTQSLPRQRRQGPADECKMLGLSLYTFGHHTLSEIYSNSLATPITQGRRVPGFLYAQINPGYTCVSFHRPRGGGGRKNKKRGNPGGTRSSLPHKPRQ